MTRRSAIRWTRWRRLVQLAIALFYIVLPVASRRGLSVSGNLAALKIGRIDLIEPAAGLSALFAGRNATATLFAGIVPVVLLALILGPVFCSWICPWGLVSERIDAFKSSQHWSSKAWEPLRRIRPLSLATWFAVSVLISVPLPAFFSAPRLITSLPLEAIFLRISPLVTGLILAGLLVLEMFAPRRIWCRALCPAGALANYLRCKKTVKVMVAERHCVCTAEPLCLTECRWGLDPRNIRSHDGCTNCMRCVEICPSGALAPVFRDAR